jgi:uncharacterized protein YhfF
MAPAVPCAAAVWSLDADMEPGAKVGDIEIVLSHMGWPVAITRVLDAHVVPFDEMGDRLSPAAETSVPEKSD